MALELEPLRNALASLESALAVIENEAWFSVQDEAVRNTLVAGVVQNFEFVYELSVKMLRRQLELEASSQESVDGLGFRDMLRLAGERGLIRDVEAWFAYRQLRNITSHTYDHKKARDVLQGARPLAREARAVLKTLEGRHA